MRVRFKGASNSFECSEPVEQKVFRAGVAAGWAAMFHFYGDIDSSEADEMLTPDAISELTFTNEDAQATSFAINGYSKVTSCTIKHRAGLTVTELQLTKTDEEATENGTV